MEDRLRPVWYVSARVDGDFAIDGDPAALAQRRRTVIDAPWTWLRQVHGGRVVTVDRPGGGAGTEADAAVTTIPGAPLAVHTADCAPIMLLGDSQSGPVVGVVHAGWRGLLADVVTATVDRMSDLGARELRATVGPCIHPECYEFGPADLDRVARHLGDDVRGRTGGGRDALDLPAAARTALARAGVSAVDQVGGCTSCDADRYFSHRARGERERMATVVWLEAERR